MARAVIVVVGDQKKFDQGQPLSTLGKVQAVDYKQIAEADRTE